MESDPPLPLPAAMLNLPLFVVMRALTLPEKAPQVLPAHLEWIVAAERRGEIFASGPFMSDAAPSRPRGGMTILRAASLQEAARIVGSDPFVQAGVHTIEIRKWVLMEGRLNVTVSFSDQTMKLT